MFDADSYMQSLQHMLKEHFEDRLVYVGLQGSYLRNEATESSDIDPMVVIENISPKDLDVYKGIVVGLEYPEKSCGFLCGKEELAKWNPLEICHLLHGTKDYYGVLSELVPSYTREDVCTFIKLSVNNLLHEITHRYVHRTLEHNEKGIVRSYKSVFFILQSICYLECGKFPWTKAELLPMLSGKDARVLETTMALQEGKSFSFPYLFDLLFSWCQEMIIRL